MNNKKEKYNVAIVGASGAVGEEMISCLGELNIPIDNLVLLASQRSAGKECIYKDKTIRIEELNNDSFIGMDVALFSAGASVSKKYAPIAVKSGAVVIDNSSAYRMDDAVPLVIPEINSDALRNHSGIIANPNCSTIISLMALAPLHKKWGLKKIIASTYQAVSGSGAQAILELEEQQKALLNKNASISCSVYPKQIANNVIPHVDIFLDNFYTKEEMKMAYEGRKILECPELAVSVTCVRVPVYRAHSISICAQFEKEIDFDLVNSELSNFSGLQVKGKSDEYFTPIEISGKNDCYVSRVRKDLALENALSFWVVGDQIKKGAALNAVQILGLLVK